MENLFTTWLLSVNIPSPLQISNFLRAVAVSRLDINDIVAASNGRVLNSYYLDALNTPIERKISRSGDRKDHWESLVTLPYGIRKQYIVDKYLKKVPGASIAIPRFPGGVKPKGPPPKETVPHSFKPTKNDIEDFTELTRLGYISNFDLVDMAGVKSLNEDYIKILGEELIRRSKILNFLGKNRKAFMELIKGKTRQVTPPRSSFMNSKESMDEYFKKLSKKEKAEEKASGKTVLAGHLRGRYIEGPVEGSIKSQRKLSDDRKKIEKELMVLIDKDGDIQRSGYKLIHEKDEEPYYKWIERPGVPRPHQEALLKKLINFDKPEVEKIDLKKINKKHLKETSKIHGLTDEKKIIKSVEKIQQKKANMWLKGKNAEDMAKDMDAFVKKQKKYTDRVLPTKLVPENYSVDALTKDILDVSLRSVRSDINKKRKRLTSSELNLSKKSLKRMYEEDKKNRRGVKEIVLPKSKFNAVNKLATAIDSLVLNRRGSGSSKSSSSSSVSVKSSRRGSTSGSAKSSRRSSVASGYSQVPSDDEES